MSNGASMGGGDFSADGWHPATVGGKAIKGLKGWRRVGRWLELCHADGRRFVFDPIDLAGCEIDSRIGGGIVLVLRGRSALVLEHVAGRDVWALLLEAIR